MFRTLIVLTSLSFLAILSVATPVLAQTPSPKTNSQALRASIAKMRFDTTSAEAASAARPIVRQTKKMGTGKRIGWTALAGVGGFFAGAYIGAAIEGDRCHCDDPGLQGALTGMPIGASAAAITTWVMTGR